MMDKVQKYNSFNDTFVSAELTVDIPLFSFLFLEKIHSYK
jgi:hypothetical protein